MSLEKQVNELTFAGHCNLPSGLPAHIDFLKRDGWGHWEKKKKQKQSRHSKMGGIFIATLHDLREQEKHQRAVAVCGLQGWGWLSGGTCDRPSVMAWV